MEHVTINTTDENAAQHFYDDLMEKVNAGKLVAVIPVTCQGRVGTWSTTYAVEPGHITNDESALMAAMIATNMTRRSARVSGVLPL